MSTNNSWVLWQSPPHPKCAYRRIDIPARFPAPRDNPSPCLQSFSPQRRPLVRVSLPESTPSPHCDGLYSCLVRGVKYSEIYFASCRREIELFVSDFPSFAKTKVSPESSAEDMPSDFAGVLHVCMPAACASALQLHKITVVPQVTDDVLQVHVKSIEGFDDSAGFMDKTGECRISQTKLERLRFGSRAVFRLTTRLSNADPFVE